MNEIATMQANVEMHKIPKRLQQALCMQIANSIIFKANRCVHSRVL